MRRLVVAALFPLVLAGCSGIVTHEGERNLNRRELAPGPGLFTGEAGAWIILRRELPSPKQTDPSIRY
jgi:hypothetical protein